MARALHAPAGRIMSGSGREESARTMRYHALAVDFDGTLAHDGHVAEPTVEALIRLKHSGRRLLLVTGRRLPSLQQAFERLDLCDLIVAEDGALLYDPRTQASERLGPPPPSELIAQLRARGVAPLAVGEVIVATRTPHEATTLAVIRELGLEYQIIFNKGAVMLLPPGLNKATGLLAALDRLGLSRHNVAGIGDAENDHAFLRVCEAAAAVANALPAVREQADLVTRGDHGAGVVELAERLLADDLADLSPRLTRHHILIGHTEEGAEVRFPAYGPTVLVAGSEGSGKSTLTTGILERMAAADYQFCLIDPEGDYENLEPVIYLGGPDVPPDDQETIEALKGAGASVAVSLLALPLPDRPAFFERLLPRLQSLRARLGRPHWVFVDEAHHMLPADWAPASVTLPRELHSLLLITVHPDHVSRAMLATVGTVIAVGRRPDQTIAAFCAATGSTPPALEPTSLAAGEVLVWQRGSGSPLRVRVEPGQTERRRHRRKYMQGELIPEERFHFRGPEGKLDLPAQNLQLFLQIGEGVDEETWRYHLQRHDYSTWFADVIKDEELAAEVRRIEDRPGISAQESRRCVRAAVEARYTMPA